MNVPECSLLTTTAISSNCFRTRSARAGLPVPDEHRLANLRAALGFLQLAPRARELRLLHRWLDTWTGVGLIAVGVERQGLLLSLSHIAEGEWRAQFMGNPLVAPKGFGVAPTPWRAVQVAAWAAVKELAGEPAQLEV
jgi:hypothetical protein